MLNPDVHLSQSHVGPPFVATFGESLTMLRKLMQTSDPSSQPFVISGSGTLGWDFVAANLAERGDDVLVLHTGYFADSFADCFETYGVSVTQLKAPIGDRPQLPEIEKALKEKKYKLVTVTHVDTSTGVLSEIEVLSDLVHRISPETLVVVDGVCSVGCEDIQFDKWKIDVVLTASQKAIGCPAGLCIFMCSGRAIESYRNRKTAPASYFASFKNWLPSKIGFLSRLRTQLTYSSNAKLRSQEGIILRNAVTAANPRAPRKSFPDSFTTPFGAVCSSPGNIATHQISHQVDGPYSASKQT